LKKALPVATIQEIDKRLTSLEKKHWSLAAYRQEYCVFCIQDFGEGNECQHLEEDEYDRCKNFVEKEPE